MGPIESQLRQVVKKWKASWKVFCITGGIGLVLEIIGFVNFNNNSALFFLFVGLLFIIGALIYSFSSLVSRGGEAKRIAEQARELPRGITEDGGIWTMQVKSRVEGNYPWFSIEPKRYVTTSSSPERYVFTGATVGGVTTGGFTKIGGVKTSSSTSSKEFEIIYHAIPGNIGEQVYRFKLQGNLAEEARKDEKIRKMLKGNTIDYGYSSSVENLQLIIQWISGMGTDTVLLIR